MRLMKNLLKCKLGIGVTDIHCISRVSIDFALKLLGKLSYLRDTLCTLYVQTQNHKAPIINSYC